MHVCIAVGNSFFKPNQDDEILVPSMTFIASVNAIFYNNCKPIFLDCDEDYLLDFSKTREFISKNTFKKMVIFLIKKPKKELLH